MNSVESLIDDCGFENIFGVGLSSHKELEILLHFLGVADFVEESLPHNKIYSSVINLSSFKLPEFNQDDFDTFYQLWLAETGRENSMDEYGQLLFIQGLATRWDQRPYKVILSERA